MTSLKECIKQSHRLMNAFYKLRFYAYGNKYRNAGTGNKLFIRGALLRKNSIELNGNNNRIEIGDSTQVSGCRFVVSGDNHTLCIGIKGSVNNCNFFFEDHNCSILIGDHFRMYKNGEISAVEPYSKVEIGNYCLFSIHIDIRNTDSHSIIDMATGARINPGKNIKIEDRVWIGAYVQVLKGVTIGSHSIIGIRSLVTKDISAHTLAAGVPARIMKTNIDWTYERI